MKQYEPSDKEKKIIKEVYTEFDLMSQERNREWRYFNDRTLTQFIDDNEKRANSYVLSKEEQGKEKWQANVFHPVTRNKLKAILAAVATDIPPILITAQNQDGDIDFKRAEITKHLVAFSFNQEDPQTEAFFEAWECATKGTVITYDGCEKLKRPYKEIKSVDTVTGDVEFEEYEKIVKDELVDFIVPVEEVFIRDFHIRDIQDQPALVWASYIGQEDFEAQYGGLKNFKNVKANNFEFTKAQQATYFTEDWKGRVDGADSYEVLRYYNTHTDTFRIIANGVILMDMPMLWSMKGRKVYPFAKSIFEPFAQNFFYGNALPNTLLGEQDVINTLYNMALDKTYKSMVPPMLIGDTNRDDFDLEDEEISSDTKIYVNDINQVREMQIEGVGPGDVKMIDIISRGLDLSSVDSNQQGVAGRGVTAREVVIANENAKKLKGILYLFLSHLWLQKINLRIMNILTYYTLPKVSDVIGEEKAGEYKKFVIDGAELSDGTKGMLEIQMVGSRDKLPSKTELDVKEQKYEMQGKNYEALAITSDYINNWHYNVKVTQDDLYKSDPVMNQSKIVEKLKTMAAFFPQIYMANSDIMFKDLARAFDDDPDKYKMGPPQEQLASGQPSKSEVSKSNQVQV